MYFTLDFLWNFAMVVVKMENCAVALDADDDFHEVSPILSCGVYALVHRGVIVYIGQSKVMLGRISNHRAQWGRKRGVASSAPRGILFDQVFVRPCTPEQLNALESSMIAKYQPKYNVQLRAPLPPDLLHILAATGVTMSSLHSALPPPVRR